jgi:hypothetical protein
MCMSHRNLRHRSCRSFARNRLDRLGFAVVCVPRCVVTFRVCLAESRGVLQFLASRSAVRSPFLLPVDVDKTLTLRSSDSSKQSSCKLGSMSINTAEHWEVLLTKAQARSRDTLLLETCLPLFPSPVSWTMPGASIVASSCSWKVVDAGSHSGLGEVRSNRRQFANSACVGLQVGKVDVTPQSPKGTQSSSPFSLVSRSEWDMSHGWFSMNLGHLRSSTSFICICIGQSRSFSIVET